MGIDPKTVPTKISPEQEACFSTVIGAERVAEIKAGEPFVFKFEIYSYGWLKLPYYSGSRVYKLLHGKDYSILWNRRTKNWTVVEVPE